MALKTSCQSRSGSSVSGVEYTSAYLLREMAVLTSPYVNEGVHPTAGIRDQSLRVAEGLTWPTKLPPPALVCLLVFVRWQWRRTIVPERVTQLPQQTLCYQWAADRLAALGCRRVAGSQRRGNHTSCFPQESLTPPRYGDAKLEEFFHRCSPRRQRRLALRSETDGSVTGSPSALQTKRPSGAMRISKRSSCSGVQYTILHQLEFLE